MEHRGEKMWDIIKDSFGKYPSQMKVAKYLVNYGFSVKEKFDNEYGMFSGAVEVRPSSLAGAIGVDKRVVMQVMKKIIEDPKLFEFFSLLGPIADMSRASSKLLNLGIVEIIPEDASEPGIIANIINIISSRGIGIRQVIVKDPIICDEPKARVVTDTPIPPELITEMKKVKGIKGITLL